MPVDFAELSFQVPITGSGASAPITADEIARRAPRVRVPSKGFMVVVSSSVVLVLLLVFARADTSAAPAEAAQLEDPQICAERRRLSTTELQPWSAPVNRPSRAACVSSALAIQVWHRR